MISLIAEFLNFYGCKRIYEVGGDYAASLIKSLEDQIELLPCGNKMHAGFIACGQDENEITDTLIHHIACPHDA